MKYAIVTGASSGLGEAMALELLADGQTVIAIARRTSDRLQKAADSGKGHLHSLSIDLAETDQIEPLFEQVVALIDWHKASSLMLINNAGAIEPIAPLTACTATEIDRHMRINLIAPTILIARFIQQSQEVVASKNVINISSGAGKNPYHGWSSYCTGKAGLDMLTRAAALEQNGQDHPIKLLSVAPGIVDTPMQDRIRQCTPEQFAAIEKFVALKEQGLLSDPQATARFILQLPERTDLENGAVVDVRKLGL